MSKEKKEGLDKFIHHLKNTGRCETPKDMYIADITTYYLEICPRRAFLYLTRLDPKDLSILQDCEPKEIVPVNDCDNNCIRIKFHI